MMGVEMKMKTVGFCDGITIPSCAPLMNGLSVADESEYVVFPGFCDVHVHFRDFLIKRPLKPAAKHPQEAAIQRSAPCQI